MDSDYLNVRVGKYIFVPETGKGIPTTAMDSIMFGTSDPISLRVMSPDFPSTRDISNFN